MEFNLNETVKVKLNDHGRSILRENHDRFIGTHHVPEKMVKYTPPKEDENGYSSWQFWHLMKEFGQHMGLCEEPPFCLTITIER
jgi:hypothetical protein